MKKLLFALLILMSAVAAQAQTVITVTSNPFEQTITAGVTYMFLFPAGTFRTPTASVTVRCNNANIGTIQFNTESATFTNSGTQAAGSFELPEVKDRIYFTGTNTGDKFKVIR
jgi:hypothetical protein